jgi:hypothetical protein
MARFFFHLKRGDEIIEDDEGTDLPNTAEARERALQSAREILTEAIKGGWELYADALIVTDDQGEPVAFVPLVEALPQTVRQQLAASVCTHDETSRRFVG